MAIVRSWKKLKSMVLAAAVAVNVLFGAQVALAAPEFTVNTGTVLADYVGHGTQYNSNLYASISAVDGITTANVGDLETKVEALGSQHVRIFFDSKAFDTVNYPDYMSSFIKTVELAQSSGSTVNITYWHGPYTNVNTQMQAFADVLYDLRVTRGLTCVQYVTIQNEVNTTSITQSTYESLYRALDADLTAYGIRSSMKLIGGDLVYNNQLSWFTYMGNNMSDVLDGYSVHIYWDYDDTAYAITRLNDVRSIVNGLPAAGRKPVYITEYGIRGDRTTCDDPGCLNGTSTHLDNTLINAFQHAWFHFQALNRKFVATVKWDAYKAKYDNGTQYYSEIGSGTDLYPTKPVYDVTRLLTQTAEPGWHTLSVSGTVAGKTVAALKGATTNDMAVYALNDTGAQTTISVGGLPAFKRFTMFIWNQEGTGGIQNYGDVLTNGNGVITVTLPDQSFAALTTLATDDLERVAHYNFDETSGTTAADSTNFNHTATLNNGPTWTSAGMFGGALHFDGVNDYVRTPNILNPGKATSFSAFAWVKRSSSSSVAKYILQQEGTTGRYWLSIRADGSLQSFLGNAGTISTAKVPVGQWSYVGLTYDGTTLRLYINGKLDTTATRTLENSTDTMLIGADKALTSFWDGDIDEVSIYDRKLTVEDVKDIYNSGYWRFDETSGTIGNDSSGVNQAATLHNGANWTAGRMDGALHLDGVDDYASIPNLLDPAATPFSAAAWVKLDADTDPSVGEFILQQDGTNGRIWLCRTWDGKLETFIGNAATVSTYNVLLGVWTHVAVTYDGTTVKLYVNGVPDTTAARTAESSTDQMLVGTSKVFDRLWNGEIDNLHIYSRKLSDAEVNDLYSQSR